MHILLSVLQIILMVLVGRISTNIKTFCVFLIILILYSHDQIVLSSGDIVKKLKLFLD